MSIQLKVLLNGQSMKDSFASSSNSSEDFLPSVTCTRLIPCLDLNEGHVVKGTNFKDLRDVGDAVELAKRYQDEGADELILLDISATQDGRTTFFHTMEEIADTVSIPVGIGGGIRSVSDATSALLAGAEKIGVNSAAVENPELISELSSRFGAQCVMVSIDARQLVLNDDQTN